jgi:conjugative transfer signal peptidase TraF
MCALMLGVVALRQLGLVLNVTPSMPIGLYRATPLTGGVARGDIVQACPPAAIARFGLARGYVPRGSCPSGIAPFLKIVVALGGDRIAIGRDGVRVNGTLLPNSKREPVDGRRRPLPAVARASFALAPGEVWLWTPYPASWDSRYYGPLRESDLIARARLVVAFQPWPYATP